MAGFTQTEQTPVGRTGTLVLHIAESTTTKVATNAADATRLEYAKQGDIFIVSCTDGYSIGLLQSTGAIADANA